MLFEDAGVGTLHGTPHRFRHAFATTLLRPGVDLATLRDRVGGLGYKRHVPVVDLVLHDWLAEHVTPERRLSSPDGPLFPNPDAAGEGWWSETSMRRTWRPACEKAGVPGVSLYEGTKHSTATHLKAAGMDDRVLALLMGHRDRRSVEKYAKLDSNVVRLAMERAYRRARRYE